MILKDFSLKVEPLQTVGLVGFSGSGKSTIVQLLERFYDTDAGDILIDGVPIKELHLPWLRRQIGLVSQEPLLFDMTIEENLRLGCGPIAPENITVEQLHEACKLANAHEFIMKLPKGYQTRVGERGSMFSGGQLQRICLARGILRQPKILIADEYTSALDTESEKIIQAAMEKVATKCTTIMIAHRLSTIRSADLIVVMDKGQILESGKHDELIARGSHYAQLVKAQEVKGMRSEEDKNAAENEKIKLAAEAAAVPLPGAVVIDMKDGVIVEGGAKDVAVELTE